MSLLGLRVSKLEGCIKMLTAAWALLKAQLPIWTPRLSAAADIADLEAQVAEATRLSCQVCEFGAEKPEYGLPRMRNKKIFPRL